MGSIVVYKIPYRRARAWPSARSAFRPSASREQRYLAYKQHCAHGPKTNLKMSGRVLAFNSYLKIEAVMHIYVCDL